MPRRARLSLPGIPWHIIQRGNNRSVCFYGEDDYRRYLDELTGLSQRFGCAIHAYVLMTNHVHLLLTPEEADGPAQMMKHLGQRYVQYINRSQARTGTLWEGRFRSCLTQSEAYVLACHRYIELNPVRAGMVRHPHDYRWTSYHANGDGKADTLITPQREYLRLGREEGARRAAYRELFKAPLEADTVDAIRLATNGNFGLGNPRFQKQIEGALGRRAERRYPGRKPAEKNVPEGQESLF